MRGWRGPLEEWAFARSGRKGRPEGTLTSSGWIWLPRGWDCLLLGTARVLGAWEVPLQAAIYFSSVIPKGKGHGH